MREARFEPRHVFRWDLDKTYLRTDFDTVRDLVKSAFEKATDKRAVPGAPALLRALKAAGGRHHRVCIISGSPEQMRTVLSAKLELDGVEYDEFILKNNLRNLLRGRFRALRAQVPYKLPALLESRIAIGGTAAETLFGDDAESDALIYSLYADLLAGRVGRRELERVLEAAQAYDDQRQHTLELYDRLPRGDVVRRILIHLDRRSATAGFERFGARLCAIFNYFQAALILYADATLGAADVLRVAREMLASGDYALASLANSLQDLLRRNRLPRSVAARLALECQQLVETSPAEWADLPPKDEIAWAFATRVRALGPVAPEAPAPLVTPPPPIDYVSLVEHERRGRR
jgi:hypothetical protein